MKEKLLSAWTEFKPYAVAFGSFVWANKTYSLVTAALGFIIGVVFF